MTHLQLHIFYEIDKDCFNVSAISIRPTLPSQIGCLLYNAQEDHTEV